MVPISRSTKGCDWGRVRHRFDILHFEHPEIDLPLVEPEQRIVIRTEVFRPRQWRTGRAVLVTTVATPADKYETKTTLAVENPAV